MIVLYLLPTGFVQLIQKFKNDRADEPEELDSNENIWRALAHNIFFGQMTTDADVNYIAYFFNQNNLFDLQTITNMSQDEWYNSAKVIIEKELALVDGKKHKTLSDLLTTSELAYGARSIKEANNLFNKENICPTYLRERTNTYESTIKLIDKLCIVFYLKYTKIILWLQNFGLAPDLCPPSRQIIKFVEDDLNEQFAHRDYKNRIHGDEDAYLAFPCIKKIKQLTTEISPQIPNLTVTLTGKVIWLYKSSQSLITSPKLKKKLTPYALIQYMDYSKIDTNEFISQLVNIDKVEILTNDLKDFLENN